MQSKRNFLNGVAAAALATAIPDLAFASMPPRLRRRGKPTLEYRNEVRASVQRWLDALGEQPYRVFYRPMKAIYEVKEHLPIPTYNITTRDRFWGVTLIFSEPVSSAMSASDIEERLVHLAGGGFRLPEGVQHRHWWIRAMPPRSHLESADIRVLEVGPGHLKIRVLTGFFAVWGRDMRAVVAADKSMPDHAYFAIDRDFSGEIIMTFAVENF